MGMHQLALRCYVAKQGDLWVAVCIDLCLGAQSRSSKDAIEDLHQQIVELLNEASKSRELASTLLTRKAPLSLRVKYHFIRLKNSLSRAFKIHHSAQTFDEQHVVRPA